MRRNMADEGNRKNLHAEWLDETGGIPDVSGWLDDTNVMPEVSEWLDETDVLPKITEQGGAENISEESYETETLPRASEWLDETETLPKITERETAEFISKEESLTGESSRENPEESLSSEQGRNKAAEKAYETEMLSDDVPEPYWTEETEDLPKLRPGDWDDDLDEEPAGWFSDEETEPAELPLEKAAAREKLRGSEEGKFESDIDTSLSNRSIGADAPAASARYQDAGTPDIPKESLLQRAGEQWKRRIGRFSGADAVVGFLAAAIAVVLIGGGITYAGNRKIQKERVLLASVGDQLPGDQVLNADTARALAAIRVEEDEKKAREEEKAREKAQADAQLEAEEGSVQVEFALSTIQSDLKVKIRRKKEQSLIGGVPFSVRIKGPDGKVTEKTDEDQDGIVYLTGLSNGTWEVSLEPLIDLESIKSKGDDYREDPDYRSYSRYRIPEEVQTIEVSDHIAYEVVDVADEVKSASEVNAAREDTARNDTPVESVIRDTVEWVESTRTEVDGNDSEDSYEEVSKSSIPDPYASARIPGKEEFRRLSSVDDAAQGTEEASAEGNTDSASAEGTESGQEENTGETDSENTGAGNSGEDDSEKTPSLSTDPSEIHLTRGKTQSIRVTVQDAEAATVTYASSDESVATVSDGGTVRGEGAGSCEIRVGLREYPEISKSVSVKVTEGTDDSSPLKDADGNPLYVKDGEDYRAATAADYSRYDTFYRKTAAQKQYRYTGWQHINGLTYYYDKNGNYVTGSQIIQGVSYTFSEEGILSVGDTKAGIDVSMWNGQINWSEVANSGISFAIVRCGYRGSSAGMLVRDTAVGTNVTGAKNAGLKVGLYFFSQAVNEAEAVEEASMAVQIARSYGISLPIFLDVESSGGRGDAISASQRTANIAAFCRTVQNAGLSAGVYANTNWFSERINTGALTSYHIWLAQYAAEPTYSRTRYDIWQYSSTGRVSGISGDVDMNISYRSY